MLSKLVKISKVDRDFFKRFDDIFKSIENVLF